MPANSHLIVFPRLELDAVESAASIEAKEAATRREISPGTLRIDLPGLRDRLPSG